MSYDLQVWSVSKPNWDQIGVALKGWTVASHGLVLESGTWQIIVGPCSLVEDEDIPEDVFGSLPGIRYLTEINLEPIHAPRSAHTHLLKASSHIARACHGVVLDPQEDTISSPKGVRRLSSAKPTGRISVIDLGWWFNESALIHDGGLTELLQIMEGYLPEALPRRYGRHEPPQFRYEEEGRDRFISFASAQKLGVVWYPTYPVLHVGLGITEGYGPRRIGYKSNTFAMNIDASVWNQPGWDIALPRFWRKVSELIRPFYGEVRLLRNYILQRGRAYIDGVTDVHPIRNGWWNGVPKPMGSAAVIDKTYGELWPKFAARSEHDQGLMYLSVDNWTSGETVDRLIGGVPRQIAQGQYARRFTYPRTWPFDGPFADD